MGAKVTFDPLTRIITIDEAPDGNGDVTIDVKADLYSDGKEDWVNTESLRRLAFPFRVLGGDSRPGPTDLGTTYFLASDWKIQPYDADHRLIVIGNIYSEDGSDIYLDTPGAYTVRIMQEQSALVYTVATGGASGDWTTGEKSQIRDALGVDGAKVTATGGQFQTLASALGGLNDVSVGDIWNALHDDYNTPGSVGWILSKALRAMVEGKAVQENNQWIIYDPDDPNIPLVTFNTFDKDNNPADVMVYKREKV